MDATKPAGERQQLRQNELKWGRELMAAGFTVFPAVILDRQRALGLDALDVNIILHLACRWWFAENPPHPSKRTIAKAMGVDPSTVRRRIAALEKEGLIEREPRFSRERGQEANRYLLGKLVKAATPFALEEIETRERAKRDREERRGRRRPKLHVVPPTKGSA